MKRWYLIYSHFNQEDKAVKNLSNQDFECVSFKTSTYKSGKKNISLLFPRYIFVCFDIKKDNWQKIIYTRGVKNLISSNLTPIPIPCKIIDNIKSLQNNSEFINPFDIFPLYQGKKIRIINGPFKGRKCSFLKMNSKDRVLVLLSFLGKTLKILIPNEYLDIAA